PRQAVRAPTGEGPEKHFGVRLRTKLDTFAFKLLAQLNVVVDLAVVSDRVPPVGRRHRLVAEGRKIKNREPSVKEAPAAEPFGRVAGAGTAVDRPAGVVGPAMRECAQRAGLKRGERPRIRPGDIARNPAHGRSQRNWTGLTGWTGSNQDL